MINAELIWLFLIQGDFSMRKVFDNVVMFIDCYKAYIILGLAIILSVAAFH